MAMVLDAVPAIRRSWTDGAARRRPVLDLGPERPVPPRDQPEQPTERLLDLQAPEIIVNNEKRMLQEVSLMRSLSDNGRRGRPATCLGNVPRAEVSVGHA